MNIYGYCRISTAKQSIDRQIRNIKAEYPTAHIVQEAYTDTSIFRPEWLKLYRILKSGDTVVFDSVSRMVCMPTMSGMMMSAGASLVRLRPL